MYEESVCNLINTTVLLIDDNILRFGKDESQCGQRIHSGMKALKNDLIRVCEMADNVRKESEKYNYSSDVPGNGFLSLCNIGHQALCGVFELLKKISAKRKSFRFKKEYYVKEVVAWEQVVASLAALLEYVLTTLLPMCEDGNLMPETDMSPSEVLLFLNLISLRSFFGRRLGFHYYKTLRKTLVRYNIGMCTFSEIYYNKGGFFKRARQCFNPSSKYIMNPELRAKKIEEIIQHAPVEFVKAFWALAEKDFVTRLGRFIGRALVVNQPILVPCQDSKIMTLNGQLLNIPAPSSHFPQRSIPCVLLSSQIREGMPGDKRCKGRVFPPSDRVMFHCHGGGFIGQSTKIQEAFLCEWADSLDVPIFCVDYSLSPEAKYPKALNEVVTAYVWMLNNFGQLGTNGTKIVITGDSAGGNLVTALTIRCIEMNIRPPDGAFLIYTPFSVKLKPSPSKLLSICDPLLPIGFALMCLKAYVENSGNLSTLECSTETYGGSSDLPSSSTDDMNFRSCSENGKESCLKSTQNKKSSNENGENGTGAFNCTEVPATSTVSEIGNTSDSVHNGVSARASCPSLGSNETPQIPLSKENKPTNLGSADLGASKQHFERPNLLIEQFADVSLLNDHYISPIAAPKSTLTKFPTTYILTVEYDFCLDDCVMMARLLRSLDVKVNLDILEKLPHGFLSLSLVSKEAHDGCKVTITRLRELFEELDKNEISKLDSRIA